MFLTNSHLTQNDAKFSHSEGTVPNSQKADQSPVINLIMLYQPFWQIFNSVKCYGFCRAIILARFFFGFLDLHEHFFQIVHCREGVKKFCVRNERKSRQIIPVCALIILFILNSCCTFQSIVFIFGKNMFSKIYINAFYAEFEQFVLLDRQNKREKSTKIQDCGLYLFRICKIKSQFSCKSKN